MSTRAPFTWSGHRPDDPAHQRLVEFLVMDIQESPAWARELCERTAEVAAGARPHWERAGNAYFVRITPQGVTIEDQVDEESAPVSLPIAQFEQAVKAWLRLSEAN